MSADSKAQRETPTHPSHGKFIVTTLPSAAAATIDCSAFLSERCLVQIMNDSAADPLYYKFCPTAGTSITTSDSISMLPNEITEKAFVPKLSPFLRVIGNTGTIVRVWQASEI